MTELDRSDANFPLHKKKGGSGSAEREIVRRLGHHAGRAVNYAHNARYGQSFNFAVLTAAFNYDIVLIELLRIRSTDIAMRFFFAGCKIDAKIDIFERIARRAISDSTG